MSIEPRCCLDFREPLMCAASSITLRLKLKRFYDFTVALLTTRFGTSLIERAGIVQQDCYNVHRPTHPCFREISRAELLA